VRRHSKSRLGMPSHLLLSDSMCYDVTALTAFDYLCDRIICGICFKINILISWTGKKLYGVLYNLWPLVAFKVTSSAVGPGIKSRTILCSWVKSPHRPDMSVLQPTLGRLGWLEQCWPDQEYLCIRFHWLAGFRLACMPRVLPPAGKEDIFW